MHRNSRNRFPRRGRAGREQLWASSLLLRPVGSDPVLGRRQPRHLRCQRRSGALTLLSTDQISPAGSQLFGLRTAARSSLTISLDALMAAACWSTLKEIAPTRACPPPP